MLTLQRYGVLFILILFDFQPNHHIHTTAWNKLWMKIIGKDPWFVAHWTFLSIHEPSFPEDWQQSLACLISFFTSQITVFQLCQDGFSWVEPVLSKDWLSPSGTQCSDSCEDQVKQSLTILLPQPLSNDPCLDSFIVTITHQRALWKYKPLLSIKVW